MADLSRSSTLIEDPLHAYSGLSLFPRTLKSLSNPLPPRLHQSDDLHQTHTLLQSMPFEIQKEHQEQAKAILDDSSELLKEGIGTTVASKDMDVGGKMNPIPNKRERRPGLDRKLGHFSFKPTTSQQPQNEPTFDASKYPNPEEYFAAYERYKIAKQEWQKQTGTVVTDAHQNQPSRRPRRPGLPGRKRGSYKHTYTDSNLTDATNLEASESKIPIPSEQSLERTTTAEVTTADRDVADSAVDTDKDFQNILTELLACAPDELEGENGVKLVEERLQFKAIDVGMLSLPEFQDVKKTDLKVSGRNPSKRRTVLSDIQNMLKGIHSDGARKNSKSPSPNPPGDQFSFPDTDHLLPGDQQSSEVDLAKDLNICSGSLLTNDLNKFNTNASPSNVGTVYVDSPFNSSVQKTSNGDNSDLNTCSGSPVTNNTDKVITNASPSIVENVKVASPFKSSVQKTSNDDDSDTHSGIRRFNSNPDGNADDCVDDLITNRNSAALEVNVDTQTKGNEGDLPINESQVNKYTDRREKDVGINEKTDQLQRLAEYASREAVRMDPSTIEEDSIPCQQDASLTSINRAPEQYNTVDGAFERVEHSEGQHGEGNDNTDTACGVEVENAQEEVHNSSHKESNKRRKRRSLYSNTKKRSKTVHGESEGEMQMKTLSHESGAKKQTKRKSNEREEKKQMKTVTREGKAFSRRKSLAGAGTKWESGFRRSTRIKSRPLEYWRGERFLFGRIHQSLATVIGIKYESPGKGQSDKPKLKVKSFVSDDYIELIDLAALH